MTRTIWFMTALAVTLGIAACDDSATGIVDGGAQSVTVRFSVAGGGTGSAVTGAGGPFASLSGAAQLDPIEGTNGTLEIDDVRLIVSELEFEGDDDACETEGSDDCAEFEAGPSFVDLPLDGSPFTVGTDDVDPGFYDEFELEVEDLEDDEDDAAEAAAIDSLRNFIAQNFGEWPAEASAFVAGTFTPVATEATPNPDPRPFGVFLEAEIEVEMDLAPPLSIDESGASREVTVLLDPAMWFRRADGSVMDLSQFDFETTGSVREFEVEMEDGFVSVEHDDDELDDQEDDDG